MTQEEIKRDSSWHMSKSVPLSLLFALAVQSAVAIWWASEMSSKVTSLENSVIVLSEDLASENLRQWARINSVENLTDSVAANTQVTTAILERLESQVSDLSDEIKETNKLLRDNR